MRSITALLAVISLAMPALAAPPTLAEVPAAGTPSPPGALQVDVTLDAVVLRHTARHAAYRALNPEVFRLQVPNPVEIEPGVRLAAGAVPAKAQRGALIPSLFDAASRAVDQAKQMRAVLGRGPDPATVIIAVHPRLRYDTLVAVLYTLGQAELQDLHFAVRGFESQTMLRVTMPRIGQRDPSATRCVRPRIHVATDRLMVGASSAWSGAPVLELMGRPRGDPFDARPEDPLKAAAAQVCTAIQRAPGDVPAVGRRLKAIAAKIGPTCRVQEVSAGADTPWQQVAEIIAAGRLVGLDSVLSAHSAPCTPR